MIDNLICWWKGHNIDKYYYRAPVYVYWRINKESHKYEQKDMFSDLDNAQYWCHRCWKYIEYRHLNKVNIEVLKKGN